MKTHYDTLGVAPDASESEIRSAYRRAALLWHPDKNPRRRQEAHDRFVALGAAFAVLSGAETRRAYDAELARRAAFEEAQRAGAGAAPPPSPSQTVRETEAAGAEFGTRAAARPAEEFEALLEELLKAGAYLALWVGRGVVEFTPRVAKWLADEARSTGRQLDQFNREKVRAANVRASVWHLTWWRRLAALAFGVGGIVACVLLWGSLGAWSLAVAFVGMAVAGHFMEQVAFIHAYYGGLPPEANAVTEILAGMRDSARSGSDPK